MRSECEFLGFRSEQHLLNSSKVESGEMQSRNLVNFSWSARDNEGGAPDVADFCELFTLYSGMGKKTPVSKNLGLQLDFLLFLLVHSFKTCYFLPETKISSDNIL